MKLTKENILKRSNSYEILTNFIGRKLKHNQLIKSPFREERTGSFCIYKKGQEWRFKDHGGNAQGSAFDFVMQLYGCDFRECLEAINNQLNLGLSSSGSSQELKPLPPRKALEAPEVKEERKYFRRPGSWKAEELEFWYQFGITKPTLDFFQVQPVELFSLETSRIDKKTGKPKIIECYAEKEGLQFSYQVTEDCFKIYRPGKDYMKFVWLGKKPEDYVFGLSQLPETGKLCILTGGEKDVLTLHSLGFHAISLNSETAIPSEDLLKEIKRRFEYFVSLYDNDKTGKAQAKKLQNQCGINPLSLPEFHEKGKDISDWAKLIKPELPPEENDIVTSLLVKFYESSSIPENPTSVSKKEEKPTTQKKPSLSSANSARKTGPLHSQGTNDTRSPGDPYKNISQLNFIKEVFGLKPNPDFAQNGKEVICYYQDLNGKQLLGSSRSSANSKVEIKRALGTYREVRGVYIPPMIRDMESELIGETLFICEDEIAAYILSEFKVPTVSISCPDGFLANSAGTPKLNGELNRLIIKRGFKSILYLLPSIGFRLHTPAPKMGADLFEHENAARNAERVLSALNSLCKVFPEKETIGISPKESRVFPSAEWFIDFLKGIFPGKKKKKTGEFLHKAITKHHGSGSHFKPLEIGRGTLQLYKKALFMQSVDAFAEFHGIEGLGRVFTWGRSVYEAGRDGTIALKSTGREAFNVFETNKCYAVKVKNETRIISNFTMKYVLEIKQEDSIYLAELTHQNGVKVLTKFSNKQILNVKEFKLKVADLGGAKFSFRGSQHEIEEIHAFERDRVEEAETCKDVLGIDQRTGNYVWGNGILSPTEGFVLADDSGVVRLEGENYFIPAAAKDTSEDDSLATERGFIFNTDSNVSFIDWARLFIQVHGMYGHVLIMYMIAAHYRDIIKGRGHNIFPHFFVNGVPGSGKSAMLEQVLALYGKIPFTNFKVGVTPAAMSRKFMLLNSAIMPFNEVDVTQDYIKKRNFVESLVGAFDYQGREITVNNKSMQFLPKSAVIMAGQEKIWHLDAFSTRCIVQSLPPGNEQRSIKEKDLFQELSIMSANGVSHLIEPIFKARGLVKTEINKTIDEFQNRFMKETRPSTPSRLIYSFSMIISPLIILLRNDVIKYPMSEAEIFAHFARALNWQAGKRSKEGVIEIFLNFIYSNYGPNKLFHHQHAFHTDYKGKMVFRLKVPYISGPFADYVRKNNLRLENISKGEIEARLKKHPAFIRRAKNLDMGYKIDGFGRVRKKNGEIDGLPIKNNFSGWVIELDPDLIEGFDLPDIIWTEEEEEAIQTPTNPIFANAN